MNASKAPTILGGETMAQIQLVVFELNGEEYGVDALAVSGILRPQKSVKSPRSARVKT